MMTSDQIRKTFLEFFAARGHRVIASDSVVPKDDPTVLFTTAGMQQFKRQFLGQLDGYTRAATSQKCIRTDDLDVVGKTAFHHTFFEMLGNFSFGDYFKKDAIAWAWEFLTQVMGIPADRLWVSVYQDDLEAENVWLKDIQLPQGRVIRLGDKSNFWPSQAKAQGPNGPCGPCSEIFYDYGPNPQCGRGTDCSVDCDCGRFAEIWNLVFTQFNRKDGGILEPLPAKNIDTGMGLERLAAVMQGQRTNFQTDLFRPILKAIEEKIVQTTGSITTTDQYIIADHIRAIVFAINDGVIPSNKERGSVVKRLITDSTNIVLNAGHTQASIYQLVPAVVRAMKGPYPQIGGRADEIAQLIKRTEEAFISVRQQRIPELKIKLQDILKKDPAGSGASRPQMLGELFFIYRDTYGLPLPTILQTTEGLDGMTAYDLKEAVSVYQGQMDEQQERSRCASKLSDDVFTNSELKLDVPKTLFTGHNELRGEGKILRIFKNDRSVEKAFQGDEVKIVLDQTPFYAESGGQVGDTGTLEGPNGTLRVKDTIKIADVFLHVGEIVKGHLACGENVHSIVDEDRRLSIMRNHTATHLLQAALREVLGGHVQQQGSFVAEDRLRFDFTHHQALTLAEIKKIEESVFRRVLACAPVSKVTMPIDQAQKSGALAFFAEKYGDTVRVVSIAGYSKEFCGGTHLDSTGQIGILKITGESAIAQGIRRIEAKTGLGASALINQEEEQLSQIAKTLRSRPDEILERIQTQLQKTKNLEKDLAKFRIEAVRQRIDGILKITGESAIAQGIRRIEAKTGLGASALINQEEEQLSQIAKTLRSRPEEILERIQSQLQKTKNLEKDLAKFRIEAVRQRIDGMIAKAEEVNGSRIIFEHLDNADANFLRQVSDLIKSRISSTAIVLSALDEGNAYVLVAVTDDLVKRGLKANDIVTAIAPVFNGSGGGRPQLAQAGSRDIQHLPAALKTAQDILKDNITNLPS